MENCIEQRVASVDWQAGGSFFLLEASREVKFGVTVGLFSDASRCSQKNREKPLLMSRESQGQKLSDPRAQVFMDLTEQWSKGQQVKG